MSDGIKVQITEVGGGFRVDIGPDDDIRVTEADVRARFGMDDDEELCRCGEGPRYHDGCRLVSCDSSDCLAVDDPQTPEEFRAAYEHWRHHGYLCGCSHGR